MATDWTERISLFSRSPQSFLCGTPAEVLLEELLRELRDERAAPNLKVLLLTPLLEWPALLCPSDAVGEDTVQKLMSVLAQCPPRCVQLRCQLLVALASILVCTPCTSGAWQDFVELLLTLVQDAGDPCGDHGMYSVRVMACECLWELEACSPGLLWHHLELLSGLRQQESCRLHQALVGLHSLTLRNAVYHLTKEAQAGAEHLRALLGATSSVEWDANQELLRGSVGPGVLSSVVRGPLGVVPTLQTGLDCKELRSVLSTLLEESYLLTPLCQSTLLHRLTEVVLMVPGVPPALFRAQLLRLLGTCEVSLLHCTLLLKSAFTDSLFSAEDEAFFLRRLVVLSQHPLLPPVHSLFYINCILHFPENRPISFSDGDDSLPVLLTPQLASVLVPTVFNDSSTLLARLHLLCLVYLEEGEDREENPGLTFLYDLLRSLLTIVQNGGSREMVLTSFRATFLFLCHFQQVQCCSTGLILLLQGLYMQHTRLAPHLINLVDQLQGSLPTSCWAVGLLKAFQEDIFKAWSAHLDVTQLSCHLKMLSRVAEEQSIRQHKTLAFLFHVVQATSSSLSASELWRLGNAVLIVCRRLLLHSSVDLLLVPLGDVLHHMACHDRDTDVRDHARLYYTLLTTLSQEKLAGLLQQGEQQVRKQTLCCLVAESEGLTSALSIHQAEQEVLRLTELRPQQEEADLKEDQELVEGTSAVEQYREQFADPSFASTVVLKYQLSHVDAPAPGFERLFSVRLHFSVSDQNYEDLQDISVPCLFRDRPAAALTLTLKPRQPFPTTLHVSALFCTEDGLTWHCTMPPLHISFQQTFQPLPTPPAWGQSVRLKVMKDLWAELEGVGGALSLFCCQLREGVLEAMMKEHFLPFLLSAPSQGKEFNVLLFLSPCSHVLLKVRSEEDAVHFNIATDNSQLLPHINSYLSSITAPREDAIECIPSGNLS